MAKKEVPTLMVEEFSGTPPKAPMQLKDEKPKERDRSKVWCKAVHMGLGVDLLGSKTSLVAKRDSTLEVTPLGVKATSGKNGRVVLIPWANIKGCELFSED